jgi:hypothetical protein
METYQLGREIPWILLRFDPVPAMGYPPDFQHVVERIKKIAEAECNATA